MVGSDTMEAGAGGIALYLHIPFCQTKCSYCDFNTYAGINDLIPGFVRALCGEIAQWGRLLGGPEVETVFFGGGTPSLLSPEQLALVMDTIRGSFRLSPGAEVTTEANPEDVTRERMAGFLACGVNRVSMGVQTLDRGLLKVLGRRHTVERAGEAMKAARAAGFTSINLDLMYGLSLQTLDQWRATLQGVLALRPEHLSAYCLTLEEGTALHRWVRRGSLPEPDEDLAADMYNLAEDVLGQTGYRHYEISNWTLPGQECRHNLVYWRNGPYLGVGPGAHSHLGGYRFATGLSPHEHLRNVAAWETRRQTRESILSEPLLKSIPTVAEVEAIDRRLEMAETAMLALRLDEGLDLGAFEDRFGQAADDAFPGVFAEMREAGLVDITESLDGPCCVLTPRGRLLSNEVFQRLLSVRPRQAVGGRG
ncbi:MAG: radical SAM family heme chaperone HemW [Dehalococcoidia bacterium]|nr:radical SAM family heme chaperone HemW [Dehalococcoidia bacterium]